MKEEKCYQCNGLGLYYRETATNFKKCEKCKGEGKINKHINECVKMDDKEKWLDFRNRVAMGLGLNGDETDWIFTKALEAIKQQSS